MFFKAEKEIVKALKVLTVKLDMSNPNPASWATYDDDAIGLSAGSSIFDSFIGHYPCLLKNGVEQGKLDPNDFTKFEDGTSADITSGDDGDVMIAFPRRGLKMDINGNVLTISITNEDNATGFDYSAFSYKGDECSHMYQSAYEGYYDGSKLRSLSDKTPAGGQTIGTFRTYAQANGTGYEQRTFYPLTYMQALYLLKYKGQNAQIAIGRGYIDGNSTIHNTGTTNTRGMDYGESTGKDACKLFGIEDFWGNTWDFIDGLYSDSSRNILTADGDFNDSATSYINQGSSGFTSDQTGFFSRPKLLTVNMGFIPDFAYYNSGSETTYFCDWTSVASSKIPVFGGQYTDGNKAGVFFIYITRATNYKNATTSARLSYFKLKS